MSSSKSKGQSSLRQGTLSFGAKRLSSATKAKQPAKPRLVSSLAPPRISTSEGPISIHTSSSSSNNDIDSDNSSITAPKREGAATQNKASAKKPSSKNNNMIPEAGRLPSLDSLKEPTVDTIQRPELRETDPRFNRHYALVQDKMGHVPPIHGEGQNRIHAMLRVFDLSYEYGPSIGVTRLERWERANSLGLHPPAEIYEILSTRQGVVDPAYAQCIFYEDV